MQVTRVVKFIRKGEKGDKGDKGDPGTNYLILGWWSDEISYKLSDAGIPVVKVPDGTSLGFSVYELVANSSTIGVSPAGSSEWGLVESTEFMYMQEAYIERLQAALITAEYIESLKIVTGNLEVVDGAKIAGLDVEGGVLVSANKKLVIDGTSNTIYLLDDNGNLKTVIRPGNLPATVASYFSGTGGGSASLDGLKGNLNAGITNLNSGQIVLAANKSYEISVPAITLSATVDYQGSFSAFTQVNLWLTNGSSQIPLGNVRAVSTGGTDNRTETIAASVRAVSGGSWRLMANITIEGQQGTYSGTGTVSSTATTFSATEVVNKSEIGSNGMMIATSSENYNFMVGGTFEVRRGNNMLRVNSLGIQKSTNGGASWTSL